MAEESKTTILKSGKLRGYKLKYEGNDTTWYTVGTPFKPEEDDNDIGICYDFKDDEINDLSALLEVLKKAEPDFVKKDPEYEARMKKMREDEKTLWYKIKDDLEDIHVSFTPFYWRFHTLFASRPVTTDKVGGLNYKVCKGFYLGPLCITCGDRLAKFIKKILKRP